ncbi:sensor histidine kinase [Streptomyces sp. bgisy100]|uniref:sensor histidine kinase n=1 Tax=Streptomyces sp. bgisy100 TaxID=3413783 RepID=UPI003D7327EF
MTSLAVGPGLARPQRWLRDHPLALDAALAAVVLALILLTLVTDHSPSGPRIGARTPTPWSVGLALLACSALVFRRRMPRQVLGVTGALTLVELFTEPDERGAPVALSAAVALYTIASRTDRSTTWRAGALTVVALTAAAMYSGPGPWYDQQNIGILAWTGLAAAIGDAVRSRRAVVDAIRERAERAERTREEEARRRVAEERMRIARELHDVVAHHIALVNVQAGVAAHVMDSRPDQAKEALAHVREASRSALHELRATVGLLRQSGDPEAPTEPAPGLGVLDQLVDGFARAGLPVDVEVSSTAPEGPWHSRSADRAVAVIGDLPAAVDLTAYRVVQEALTNIHKHAGDQASATVRIARAWEALEITVLDDGTAVAPERAARLTGRDGARSDIPRGDSVRTAGGKSDSGRTAGGKGTGGKATGGKGTSTKTTGGKADAARTPAPRDGRGEKGEAARSRGARGDGQQRSDGGYDGADDEGGGHGLIGMRERAAALGGSCEAGPRYGGGFRVHVRLPLTTREGAT